MNKKSRSKDKHSIAKKQVETSPLLPSTDILQNLIGGPELHVPDWPIFKLIRQEGRNIPGLAEFQLYVEFLLEKCSGYINKPQWHSRQTIMQAMKMKGNHLSRYESKWIELGWILKDESGGRTTSHRTLGSRFNEIRINQIQSGSSYQTFPSQNILSDNLNPIQTGSSNPIQIGSSNQIQNGSTNPNNSNPNQNKEEKDARVREPDLALRDSKNKVKMTEEEKKEAIRRKCSIIQMHVMQMKKR